MRPLALLVLAQSLVLLLLIALLAARGAAPAAVAPADPDPPAAPATDAPAASADVAPRTTAAADGAARTAVDAAATAPDPAIGILVTGTVREAAGDPVPGATVGFAREGMQRSGQTGPNGVYAASGLAAGEWTVQVRAEGYAPFEGRCVLDGAAFQRFDVELRKAVVVRVRFRTADDGDFARLCSEQGIHNDPYVVATAEPLPAALPPGENGRVQVGTAEWFPSNIGGRPHAKVLRDQGFAGELRLAEPPPAFAAVMLSHVVLQTQPIAAGQHEVTFTLGLDDLAKANCTVRARFVSSVLRAPLAGARLMNMTGVFRTVTSAPDGSVALANVLPGFNSLHFQAKDHEPISLTLLVPSGGELDLGEIVVGGMVRIRGRCLDEQGAPVAGASVRHLELDRRFTPHLFESRTTTNTDAEGAFTIGGGAHRYRVTATDRGRMGYALVDATSGQPASAEIRLRATTRVTLHAAFSPLLAYTVTALDEERLPVAVARLASSWRQPALALPPGRYTIEIHDDGGRLVRSQPLVVAGEPLTVEVP